MQAKNRLTQPSKNQTTDLSVTIGYKLSRQKTIKSKLTVLDKNLYYLELYSVRFRWNPFFFFCEESTVGLGPKGENELVACLSHHHHHFWAGD